jgi:hypothetical protein
MLVVQERNANNLALVSYTRGNDLSGTLQGAGGAAGRHIAAGAGLTLSSRRFGGPVGTRAQSMRDFGEAVITKKKMAEAKAEMAGNAASRDVGQALLDYLNGRLGLKGDCASLNALREKLKEILCE